MRPFCIATIGIILGIIMGLYFVSIAFFVIVFIMLIFTMILINILKPVIIKKYIKAIFIFLICFLAFWRYTSFLEINYKTIDEEYDKQEIEIKAIVISDKIKKEYKDVYQIKVIEVKKNNESTKEQEEIIKANNKEESLGQNKDKAENQKQQGTQKFEMILNLKRDKNINLDLEYGDEINFRATYEVPFRARNEGGFDYQQYLKTKKIVGITSVKAGEVTVTGKNKIHLISKIIHDIRNSAIIKIEKILPEDTANLCTGVLLGEKTELSENIQKDFRKSSLSHILAISGAHVSYILLGITTFVQKLKLHKRWSKAILIIFLIFFMALVGFTPSVTRACIMAILQLTAGILLKRSDAYQNLAISSFIILLANPYAFLDIGFQLSFAGTVGIVTFSKVKFEKENVKDLDGNKVRDKKEKLSSIKIILQKIIKSIKEMCIVTLSANLLIIPIMMYHFNTISFTFLISNLLVAPILGACLITGIIFLVFIFSFQPIAKLLSLLLQPILELLLWIARFSGKLPCSQVLVPTPALWQIFLYYLFLYLIFFKKLKRINTKLIQNTRCKKIVIFIIIILIIFPYIFRVFPDDKLTINFIDVGQGDSMLIQTPSRKSILIDGGGSEIGNFDVGEKTLLPYLLDKGLLKIDYMIFSHFDSDHCQGLFTIMEKLKVKNAVISEQGETSANYERFLEIATKRRIKVIIVQAGDKIQIDEQCSFTILFPKQELISTNVLNNNSIVAKFSYKMKNSQEFSLLLTGDVEEIAEKKLIKEYNNTNELQATILKVAHHRFKDLFYNRIFKIGKSKNCTYWSRKKQHFWSS